MLEEGLEPISFFLFSIFSLMFAGILAFFLGIAGQRIPHMSRVPVSWLTIIIWLVLLLMERLFQLPISEFYSCFFKLLGGII